MSEKRWVQHISGQGEKWEVCKAGVDMQRWQTAYQNGRLTMYLPKSEYRLCDPPEVWKDVTGECEIACNNRDMKLTRIDIACTMLPIGYRLRKVEVNLIGPNYQYGCKKAWAFIVEQKVPA